MTVLKINPWTESHTKNVAHKKAQFERLDS